MSGVPRCPSCGNLDFGSAGTNGMITCPSCDLEFNIDTSREYVPPPKRLRRVVAASTEAAKPKGKVRRVRIPVRRKSSGRGSDRGDNSDPNKPYDPFGGSDA